MNKKILYGMVLPLIAVVVLVSASLIINSLTLNVGVKEAFEVEYAILGDGQNDYTGEACATADYNSAEDIELAMQDFGDDGDTILPGQKRFICAKITNYAGELPYTIDATIVGGDGSDWSYNQECISAFNYDLPVSGITVADDGSEPGITIDGFEVVVADDAPIVTGCKATIDVLRG